MTQQSLLDRRLAEIPEPFRSDARPLARGIRNDLVASNARGKPPVVTFVEKVQAIWPDLIISDNIKAVSGMIVAETLAPDFMPGRRKTAPRGSCMASGTVFVLTPAAVEVAGLEDEKLLQLAREVLERAAETFASVRSGKSFNPKQYDHLRLAITALQMANAEAVM